MSAPTTDQLPPHDELSEQGVLGCVMLDGKTSFAAARARFGTDEVFYDLRHAAIWSALCYLMEKDGTVDIITLKNELQSRNQLEQCGGLAYISTLPDKVPSAANVGYYVEIVWDKYVFRRLVQKNVAQVQQVYEFNGGSEALVTRVDELHTEWKKLIERGGIAPKNLCAPADFQDQYFDAFFNRKQDTYGWELPFEFPLRLRPSEMTLFTGDNGSGKSSMLGLIAIVVGRQLAKGEKIVIASLEVPPEITLWIMARQLLGVGKLELTEGNIKRIADALGWLNDRVLLYNFLGITDWRELLNTFKYAHEQHNGKMFIVDSVMRIGIADDDYALQGVVAEQFASFSIKTGAHTVLVVHENKGEGRAKDKVRGSKQWTDNAHNVCGMKRNEAKAEKIEELKQELRAAQAGIAKDNPNYKAAQVEFDDAVNKLRTTWDSKFILSKQRWPGSQQNGSRWLYFDHHALQFHEQPNQHSIDYLHKPLTPGTT